MDNKRGDPRQRVLKGGKIVFAGGSFSVDCTIRNLSATGARLQVPTTVAIPDKFVLLDAHAGTRREATVVWRKADQIGVRFEPPKTQD
jgi:PilZ domain